LDAAAAARAWAEAWRRGWLEHDVEPIAERYVEHHVFCSHPFREPHAGGVRGYALEAFADEEGPPEVWFGTPIAEGDRAAVEWWAVVTYEGKETTLAGTSILRFAEDGRVASQQDYWTEQEGRRLPPDGWGR
jgi:hypothetical protein